MFFFLKYKIEMSEGILLHINPKSYQITVNGRPIKKLAPVQVQVLIRDQKIYFDGSNKDPFKLSNCTLKPNNNDKTSTVFGSDGFAMILSNNDHTLPILHDILSGGSSSTQVSTTQASKLQSARTNHKDIPTSKSMQINSTNKENRLNSAKTGPPSSSSVSKQSQQCNKLDFKTVTGHASRSPLHPTSTSSSVSLSTSRQSVARGIDVNIREGKRPLNHRPSHPSEAESNSTMSNAYFCDISESDDVIVDEVNINKYSSCRC